jgi:sortase (surface protein transpeptidase)
MAEVVVYHVYNSKSGNLGAQVPEFPVPQKPDDEHESVFKRLSSFFNKLAIIFAITGLLMVGAAYSNEIGAQIQNLTDLAGKYKLTQEEVSTLSVSENIKPEYVPIYDPKLPKTNRITINSIGVDSDIQEATYDNYEDALKRGVWRVSDFGAPASRKTPTIMAAHRYGYLAWTNSFRKTNSFFNLPKVKVGDTITIVWHQRKYVYEVYAEDRGEEITDYSADLILYTCESLTGPVRIFKYARLLEI